MNNIRTILSSPISNVVRAPDFHDGSLSFPPRRSLFQLYKDLDPVMLRHEIVQVADDRTIITKDPSTGASYIRTDSSFENQGAITNIRGYSEKGFLLTNDTVINLRQKKIIKVSHSPTLAPRINGISDSGIPFGAVEKETSHNKLSYARAWDVDGSELLYDSSGRSVVTCAEPFGQTWFAGQRESRPTVWNKRDSVYLDTQDFPEGYVTSVNGKGTSAGFLFASNRTQATVWDNGGLIQYTASELAGDSKVLRILEDSSFIIELTDSANNKTYWIGRDNRVTPFTSEALQSIEGFPLVSIDSISPNGIMVITVMEPTSKQQARSLIGPESHKHAPKN